MRKEKREIWKNEDGSVLLEGTIVLPVLFILVFGVLEFSYFFFQQHLMSTGVRDAARYLARVSDPTDGSAQTAAQNLATTGSIAGGSARRVKGWDPGEVTISFTLISNAVGADGTRPYRQGPEAALPNDLRIVNVTGSFTWAPLGFWGFFGFGTKNVTVVHSERYIGRS